MDKKLHESINLLTSNVDVENGVISSVKLVGTESANKRRYPLNVLKDAIDLYNGTSVFIDHKREDMQRSYRDLIGHIKNSRIEEDGVYGDLQINKGHDVFNQLMADAQSNSPNVGMSHVAYCSVKRDGEWLVAEKIAKVESVDLVINPATTSTLFENEENNKTNSEVDTMNFDELTLEQIQENRTDLVEAIVSPLNDEITELKVQIETMKTEKKLAEKIEAIDKMVVKSEVKFGETFLNHLYECNIEDAEVLIQEQIVVLENKEKELSESKPTSVGKAEVFEEKKLLNNTSFVERLNS